MLVLPLHSRGGKNVSQDEKLKWILKCGWQGLCPRCGEGRMFKSFLKIIDECSVCQLNYCFAAPDDGPAFFSLCIVALPLIAFLAWFQVAIEPRGWVYALVAIPLMGFGCLLPLRPIKGWLVASQFVNKAQEAGTEKLWAHLHGISNDAENAPTDGI